MRLQHRRKLTPTPPSSYHRDFCSQPRRDGNFANIATQPMSNRNTRRKRIARQRGLETEGEDSSDGGVDGDAMSNCGDALSSYGDSAVDTAVTENEYSAEITATVHLTVHTRVFEQDGMMPDSETCSRDGHWWRPPNMFRYSHFIHTSNKDGLNYAGWPSLSQFTSYTPLCGSLSWTPKPHCGNSMRNSRESQNFLASCH